MESDELIESETGSDVGPKDPRSDLLLVPAALAAELVSLLLADQRVVFVDRRWQVQHAGDSLFGGLGTEPGRRQDFGDGSSRFAGE